MVFWSPSQKESTKQNIKIFADICRASYGMQVRVFKNYKRIYWKLHLKTEQRWDIVFIDCGNNKDFYSEKLLRSADAVVINFPQDFQIITEYFLEHHAIMGNILYLVNSHPINPKDNKKILLHTYRLKEEEIGIIPHGTKKDTIYSREVQEAVQKLLKMNCLFV